MEGPAVSPLALPQNRHPERSASPIDRVTQRACGAESKDLGGAYLNHAVRRFSTTEHGPGGPATVFMKRCTRNHEVRIAPDPTVGPRWLKSSERHRYGKRRRGSFGLAQDRLFAALRSGRDDRFV